MRCSAKVVKVVYIDPTHLATLLYTHCYYSCFSLDI